MPEERAEEAVHALSRGGGKCGHCGRNGLSDADLARRQRRKPGRRVDGQQLHEAEIARLKAERALRDAEKLGERLIGERQAISLDRDAAVAARDALACELKKAREDCRKARAELVSVQRPRPPRTPRALLLDPRRRSKRENGARPPRPPAELT